MRPLNILVTGGARGIGRACAVRLGTGQNQVAFTYRSNVREAAKTENLIKDRGGNPWSIRRDLSVVRANQQLIRKISNAWDRLDVLVANVGTAERRAMKDITEIDWDRLFRLNLKGVFFCVREALKLMIRQNSGSIVLMGSQAGSTGGYLVGAHYSLSKAGLPVLTKILAREGARYGVRVNCVAPGIIDTDLIKKFPRSQIRQLTKQIPMRRMGAPEEVAEAVAFLASSAASYITGVTLPITGGLWTP